MARLLKLTFLLLISTIGRSTVFTVTSNANTGANTLRQAVASATANGTTGTDSIRFAMNPSEKLRTILLLTEITITTSNLVIDGTTQPVMDTSIVSAGVIITAAPNALPNRDLSFYALNIVNGNNVQILGIIFKKIRATQRVLGDFGMGIHLDNASSIVIGKPGYGNVFYDNYSDIAAEYDALVSGGSPVDSNLLLQANLFNIDQFGADFIPVQGSAANSISIRGPTSCIIGGNTIQAGNKFLNNNISIVSGNDIATRTVVVGNNSFGYDYNGRAAKQSAGSVSVTGRLARAETNNYSVYIFNNRFNRVGNGYGQAYYLSDIKGIVDIKNNDIICNRTDKAIYLWCNTGSRAYKIHQNTIYGAAVGIYTLQGKNTVISQNSITCTLNGIIHDQPDQVPARIDILNLTTTMVQGKTRPLSRVEIFDTDECTDICENGKTYIGTTWSDAAGVFDYNYAFTKFSATATDSLLPMTSEFPGIRADSANIRITPATCNKSNGSIRGLAIIDADSIYWYDAAGRVVGRGAILTNVPAGRYRYILRKNFFACDYFSAWFIVPNYDPPALSMALLTIKNASCNLPNGQIRYNSNLSSYQQLRWLDAAGNPLGMGNQISNLDSGNYYLQGLVTIDPTCSSSLGPIRINRLAVPSIKIDNIIVTDASCNKRNGGISGVQVSGTTGTVTYTWQDGLGQAAGNGLDLVNVAAGTYQVSINDNSGCSNIGSGPIIVGNTDGYVLDISATIIKPAGCSVQSGSITGIVTVGITRYKWVDLDNGQIVGNAADLSNLAAGRYRLYVSNGSCVDSTIILTVPQAAAVPLTITGSSVQDEKCDRGNGSIQIQGLSPSAAGQAFEWRNDATNQPIGTDLLLPNLKAGSYSLYATDTNGCNQKITTKTLANIPAPTIDETNRNIKDDICNKGIGGVNNIQIVAGTAPITYTWSQRPANVTIGTDNSLLDIRSGNYLLVVKDANNCADTSSVMIVGNQTALVAGPIYALVEVGRGKMATIKPSSNITGKYTLFRDVLMANQLQQNTSGSFTVGPIISDTTFYIALADGDCTSSVALAPIKILLETTIKVPNAFSPNRDGVNDIFLPAIKGFVAQYRLLVFDRYGQEIFDTYSPTKGWDGRSLWGDMPAGAYYYIITGTATGAEDKPVKLGGTVILLR